MPPKRKKRAKARSPGTEADHVKLEGDCKANVKTALAKKRPREGWPKE